MTEPQVSACGMSEMKTALDTNDQVICIREPHVRSEWYGREDRKGRGGLRCLVCHRHVWIYRTRALNYFLRHERNPGAPHLGNQDGSAHEETYFHSRMTNWVRNQLERNGLHNIACERTIGGRVADVYGSVQDRQLAVQVQWSKLGTSQARERTQDLRDAGCEVLWLTWHCEWTQTLPAIGVQDFDPDVNSYECLTGILRLGSDGLVEPQRSPADLEWFLRSWVAAESAWGYWTMEKAGWALVTDWEEHTKTQAATIEQQRGELARQRRSLENLRAQIRRLQDESARALDGKSAENAELIAKLSASLATTDQLANDLAISSDQWSKVRAAVSECIARADRSEAAVAQWRRRAGAAALVAIVVLMYLLIG